MQHLTNFNGLDTRLKFLTEPNEITKYLAGPLFFCSQVLISDCSISFVIRIVGGLFVVAR